MQSRSLRWMLKRQGWPVEREMLDGPKSVRSKMTTLLSFITCMCMAEMPMLRCS